MSCKFAIALLAGLLVSGSAVAQQAGRSAVVNPGDETVLAESPLSLRLPRVAARSFFTALAWVEADETGRTRIKGTLLRDGQLRRDQLDQNVRTIDQTTTGENGWPDVAINPVSYRPGILWVHSDGGVNRLLFREGKGDTVTVRETSGVLDLPALVYDEAGVAYAAWTEINGNESLVQAAVRGPGDEWSVQTLVRQDRPYDLFPQLFGKDRGAELFYYSMRDGQFEGRHLELSATGLVDTLPMPEDIPARRLPILYHNSAGHLGAIWIEQTEIGEIYFELVPNGDGIRELFELTTSQNPIADVSVSEDGSAAKAWIEGVPPAGNQLVIDLPGAEEERMPLNPVAAEPVIALTENWAHLAWVQEDLETGQYRLIYKRVERR